LARLTLMKLTVVPRGIRHGKRSSSDLDPVPRGIRHGKRSSGDLDPSSKSGRASPPHYGNVIRKVAS